MKKILICGSSSFLMSNFIRFLSYRSKDFKIVGVDPLEKENDIKRLYFNRNHKFYIGSIYDVHFMNRVVFLEKPDIIINGEPLPSEGMKPFSMASFNCPLIKVSTPYELSHKGLNDIIDKSIVNNSGMVIKVPHTFGMRQQADRKYSHGGNLAHIIMNLLKKMNFSLLDVDLPWVYAEDVSSFLWYIIENGINGTEYYMPPLGVCSEKYMANKVCEMYGFKNSPFTILDPNLANISNTDIFLTDVVVPFKFESKSLDQSLEKTIKWFDVNRWAV